MATFVSLSPRRQDAKNAMPIGLERAPDSAFSTSQPNSQWRHANHRGIKKCVVKYIVTDRCCEGPKSTGAATARARSHGRQRASPHTLLGAHPGILQDGYRGG